MAKDKKDNILEVDVSFSTKMDDFKERFMDWQWKVREIRGQKMRFKDFNHRYGDSLKLIDKFFEVLKKDGINKTQFKEVVMQSLKSPEYNVISKFFGRKALHLWEFVEVLKLFDYHLEFTDDGFSFKRDYITKYRYVQETEMLILSSVKHPKFYIRFNTENYRDFEVNFEGHETVFTKNERSCWNQFIKLTNWYFLKMARKHKLPIELATLKAIFHLKYENKEMNVSHTQMKLENDYDKYVEKKD